MMVSWKASILLYCTSVICQSTTCLSTGGLSYNDAKQNLAEVIAPFRRRNLGTTATTISNLEIVGWWSECNSTGQCAGTYQALDTPARLDPSGNTCYVNPAANYSAIQWLGGIPDASGIISSSPGSQTMLYMLILSTRKQRLRYFPTNCSFGICSCEKVDPIRKGWNTAPNGNSQSWCPVNTQCRLTSIIPNTGSCTNWQSLIDYTYDGQSLKMCFPLAEIQYSNFTVSSATRFPIHSSWISSIITTGVFFMTWAMLSVLT